MILTLAILSLAILILAVIAITFYISYKIFKKYWFNNEQ